MVCWKTGGILTTTHDGGYAQAARSPGGGLRVLSGSREAFSTTSRWVWWSGRKVLKEKLRGLKRSTGVEDVASLASLALSPHAFSEEDHVLIPWVNQI